jgi:hypothetical protein
VAAVRAKKNPPVLMGRRVGGVWCRSAACDAVPAGARHPFHVNSRLANSDGDANAGAGDGAAHGSTIRDGNVWNQDMQDIYVKISEKGGSGDGTSIVRIGRG